MKRLAWIGLATTGVVVAGLITAIVLEVGFPRRPTREEVLAYIQGPVIWDASLSIPPPGPKRLLQMTAWNRWQIALSTYSQADQRPCIDLSYVTRRWLTGLANVKGTGRCYNAELQRSSVQLVSFFESGYAAGGTVQDAAIALLLADWRDGTQSTIPVENGAFLVTRSDEVGLISVVGLDAGGQIVDRSLTFDERIQWNDADVAAKRNVVLEEGVVTLTAYAVTVPEAQTCIQLGYLTFENLQRSVTGQTYLSSQTLCEKGSASQIGPTASTTVAGTTIAGGQTALPNGAIVAPKWSDGQVQNAIVEDGFYFAQREGTGLTVLGVAAPLE